MDSENKIDPYKNKEEYSRWKKSNKIKKVSAINQELVIEYLTDMENGYNTTRKGRLSYIRLNNLRQRLSWIISNVEKKYNLKDIRTLTDKQIIEFFGLMRKGEIRRIDGRVFMSVPDYVNVFKAFWNWYRRVEGRKGKKISDITEYIDTSKQKETEFVYFNEDEFRKLVDHAKYEYKVMMWFMYDTGIRFPTELMNIRVCDVMENKEQKCWEVDIREEISKTFGRRPKLMLCSEILRRYIDEKKLNPEFPLFPIVPRIANQYFKRLGEKVFGKRKTRGGLSFNQLTGYDFRHSSACYWLPRYKSESAMKYRFGWKKSDMIHYYTKLLGMKDTIKEEDLLTDTTKTELEEQLKREREARQMLEEKFESAMEDFQVKYAFLLKVVGKNKISIKDYETDLKEVQKKYSEKIQKWKGAEN